MATKPTRPPRGLGRDGRALWRAIAGQVHGDGLGLDARELELLESACRERDMLGSIQEALEDAPPTVKGAQGQLVAHPLLGEARRSRQTIATLLKAIGLEDPLVAKVGRGSRTTSSQARDAVMSRYGRA